MSPPDTDGPMSEELDFEQELAKVERSLEDLKQRYTQVKQDQETQAQLQQRKQELQQQLQQSPAKDLKAELKAIDNQLDELQLNLESKLFTWGSLREAFWQIVRFSGLGIVIGWFLAFAVLQQPRPETPADQSDVQQVQP